jgi:hypothetical protein
MYTQLKLLHSVYDQQPCVLCLETPLGFSLTPQRCLASSCLAYVWLMSNEDGYACGFLARNACLAIQCLL